jgi:hypothetical protein
MKMKYTAPEVEMIAIHGVQLLAGSEVLPVVDEGYEIEDPNDIH